MRILVMGMVVLVSQPVAAQYQPPNEQQYQQEDRDSDEPYNSLGAPLYRYKGSSGEKYQYDLNNQSDELKYRVDLNAQMRDEMNPDPRIEIDRGMGQYAGGASR